MNSHHSLWLTFRWPLLIAVLTLAGLVGALLEDGIWDGLGAALIAVAAAAVAWARLRTGRRLAGVEQAVRSSDRPASRPVRATG